MFQILTKKLNLYIIDSHPNLLDIRDMPWPSKKISQAKAQCHSGTHFVQQCPLVEADEEHDSTYVYHSESSGEEEVWTDLDKWRQKQQRVEAARDCQTLDSFFSRKPKTPNNGPLLVKSEQEPLSDLEQDPALQFTLSTGLDMADLCATYLETWLDEQGDDTVLEKEDEIEARKFLWNWFN